MRRYLLPLSVGIAFLSAPALPAYAQSRDIPASWGTRKDPSLETLFAYRKMTGRTFPRFRRSEAFESTGVLPLVVRFATAPTMQEREELHARGVAWDFDGKALASGAFAVSANERGIGALLADKNVARVANDLPSNAPRPAETSGLETRIAEARRALRAKDGTLLDGTGGVIADIDAGIDVFHPSFFKADGGAFVWVDVDGDGALTIDKDGVDLDGNGTIDATEVVHRLTSQAVGLFSGEPIQTPAKTFTPDIDFLYLDSNGNGKRDFGQGFTEDTPAYGEPLFVLDDANRDGSAQRSEKLLRLGTSKVRGVLSDKEFVRGGEGTSGLVNYRFPSTALLAYAAHGTGVAGILVGGASLNARWPGLAPGAELLAGDYVGRGKTPKGTTAMIQWALDRKANVILTEYAPYTGYPLDGSSEEELELDAGAAAGMVPVSPAGNLATSKKHTDAIITDATTSLALKTDSHFTGAAYAIITVIHRAPTRAVTMRLNVPGGDVVVVPADANSKTTFGDNFVLFAERATTPRGTSMTNLQIVKTNGGPPAGDYAIELAADAGPPIPVDLYAGDPVTSWGNGFTFVTGTTARTLCHPSTSDKTITVGAYTLNDDPLFSPSSPVGQIARYSSIGPRIDGLRTIDVAAPDNPMSSTTAENGEPLPDVVLFGPFGGTSGAGPHVAAAAALLHQAFPTEDAAALRQRILDHTRKDGIGDANSWGKGRLDFSAASGLALAAGAEPTVSLTPPASANVKVPFALKLAINDTSGSYRARWDLDYDGTPDTEWLTVQPGDSSPPITVDAVGKRYVRVEVIDAEGNLGASTALVDVQVATISKPAPVAAAPADEAGCGCKIHTRNRGALPFLGACAIICLALERRRRRA